MPFGTWRPPGRIRELNRNITVFCALFIVTALLAGCGFIPFGDAHRKSSEANTRTQSTAQSGVGSLDPRDLATPPAPNESISVDQPAIGGLGSDTGPPPGPLEQAGRIELTPGGMLGSLGLNLENYFAEDIQDPITRIRRVENAVIAIQEDLKAMAPPIQRLVAVENDIQELVGQLEILLESEAEPPPYSPYTSPGTQAPAPLAETAPAPTPQPQAQPVPSQPPAAYTPPASITGPAVTALRIGEHPDKVRLVLDVSGDTAYRADLDNMEKILVVELPDADWSAAREKTFGKTPVLQSYRVDSLNGEGSMLIVQLKQSSAITYQSKIDALSGTGKRIVIDLRR